MRIQSKKGVSEYTGDFKASDFEVGGGVVGVVMNFAEVYRGTSSIRKRICIGLL